MDNFWTYEKVAEFFKEHWVRTTLKESFIGSDIDFVKKFRKTKQPAKEWEIVGYIDGNSVSDCPPTVITKEKYAWYRANCGLFPDRYKIHSVKRLSNDTIFTVGDMCSVEYALAKGFNDTINHFTYCDGIIDVYFKNHMKTAFDISKLDIQKVTTSFVTKPPLGLMPEFIWKEQRIDELYQAIMRYVNAGKAVPIEWITEHYTLKMSIEKEK